MRKKTEEDIRVDIEEIKGLDYVDLVEIIEEPENLYMKDKKYNETRK